MTDAPHRSLLFSGGGLRVAYQAGAVRALFEAGLEFDHLDGTSAGALNAAMLLSGQSPDEMWERWRTFDPMDFASLLPLHEYLDGTPPALGDADGIIEKAFPHLGIDLERVRHATGVTGTFNVCNYARKTTYVIPHEAITQDLLVAGMSLPIFLPPVEHEGTPYIDAAFIRDTNLWEAVRRGADELWLLWALGNTAEYKSGFFHQYMHMLEMSANGSLFEEFARIRDLNERIRHGDSPYGQEEPITLHLIRPTSPLPLTTDLYLGNITLGTLMSMGYRDARSYLDSTSPSGLPYDPEITQMTAMRPGLTFDETMSGAFALGEDDPERGHMVGQQKDTELALHASVYIDDVERFADDPDHEGQLTGSVEFDPLGGEVHGTHGVFKLFSPGDEPDLKLMVYELAFEHDDQPYYLAGKKEVRDDPGFDLWSDTTTLYTRLHEGRDASGPVVGAGILRLGVRDLAGLVSTMRVPNADSASEKAKALSTFGRLFLGELWDSYAKHTPVDLESDDA
jgi:predicted patatin/cPLA2 family phospholipase